MRLHTGLLHAEVVKTELVQEVQQQAYILHSAGTVSKGSVPR